MGRYLTLLTLQLRTSALLAAQYRWDFLIDGCISLVWAATAIAPLLIVYAGRSSQAIPGWSMNEALVVTGWFILLQAILDGAINPGLAAVVDHIRKGTLDFVLLKPADAQFLVSTSRFQLWRIVSVGTGVAVFAVAFHRLGRWPSLLGVAQALLLLCVATMVLYSMWILIVSTAFYVVKVDNLTYMFSSIFDAARWPSSVFRGLLKLVFTFVIPLALMTTYPAEALLGRLEPVTLLYALLASAGFATASRTVWLLSLRRYSSAGG
ncbi:MAG: ABC-2 family transporter protein [Archangiaceae bacterium]|nr:ABC-2 family transporter protein [Archangiaceae bacterium]